MDAHADEQRRIKAEARVSCSLPSFLWTSIRKNGRLEAKRRAANEKLELNSQAHIPHAQSRFSVIDLSLPDSMAAPRNPVQALPSGYLENVCHSQI
jgi:hypothetical protein